MKAGKFVYLILFFFVLIFFSCTNKDDGELTGELENKMNKVAERYVKLILETGKYAPGYVDAYYGPPEWKPAEDNVTDPDSVIINSLNNKADNLLDELEKLGTYQSGELERLRYRFLYKQLFSVKGYLAILSGGSFSFDKEAAILYDAEPPHFDDSHFQNTINEINRLLPGKGKVADRWNQFRNEFIIPVDKLSKVFDAAISECRERTMQYLKLPAKETFKVEYVNNQPWGAYNWYKGNSFSVIQVNTDLPVYIDRAIDLAAHEGYPGHHVFNALLENNLVKEKGWVEYSVYPLNSPISLLAEGTANFGIGMIFPGNSSLIFEKEKLFRLAGLDSSKAELYFKIRNLITQLDYANNEAARNYLDGNWNKTQAVEYLQKFTLVTKERAEKLVQFFEKYRSYIINYNYGKELVKNYIEEEAGNNNFKRWELFKKLLTTPQTPSGIIKE